MQETALTAMNMGVEGGGETGICFPPPQDFWRKNEIENISYPVSTGGLFTRE
jgi:hypothetical protein